MADPLAFAFLLPLPTLRLFQRAEQFSDEFGISVVLDVVPSAVELMDRVRSASPLPDVLCPPDYAVRELAAEHRLLILDHNRLPNLQYLFPRFRYDRDHDLDCRVSIIKDWGTTGFMYRADLVKERPTSWSDFWNLAERYSGHVTVLDSPGEVIGAALRRRGHSYNAVEAGALEQAEQDLLTLKPHLLAFETAYRPLLTTGDAYLSLGWNGDAVALRAAGVPIQYVIPSEGSQIWEVDWAVAAHAPRVDLAYQFLDFVQRPEVAVQESRYTGYATGNQSAYALLDEQVRADQSIYPPQETLAKLEQGTPLNAEGNARRQQLWAKLRT